MSIESVLAQAGLHQPGLIDATKNSVRRDITERVWSRLATDELKSPTLDEKSVQKRLLNAAQLGISDERVKQYAALANQTPAIIAAQQRRKTQDEVDRQNALDRASNQTARDKAVRDAESLNSNYDVFSQAHANRGRLAGTQSGSQAATEAQQTIDNEESLARAGLIDAGISGRNTAANAAAEALFNLEHRDILTGENARRADNEATAADIAARGRAETDADPDIIDDRQTTAIGNAKAEAAAAHAAQLKTLELQDPEYYKMIMDSLELSTNPALFGLETERARQQGNIKAAQEFPTDTAKKIVKLPDGTYAYQFVNAAGESKTVSLKGEPIAASREQRLLEKAKREAEDNGWKFTGAMQIAIQDGESEIEVLRAVDKRTKEVFFHNGIEWRPSREFDAYAEQIAGENPVLNPTTEKRNREGQIKTREQQAILAAAEKVNEKRSNNIVLLRQLSTYKRLADDSLDFRAELKAAHDAMYSATHENGDKIFPDLKEFNLSESAWGKMDKAAKKQAVAAIQTSIRKAGGSGGFGHFSKFLHEEIGENVGNVFFIPSEDSRTWSSFQEWVSGDIPQSQFFAQISPPIAQRVQAIDYLDGVMNHYENEYREATNGKGRWPYESLNRQRKTQQVEQEYPIIDNLVGNGETFPIVETESGFSIITNEGQSEPFNSLGELEAELSANGFSLKSKQNQQAKQAVPSVIDTSFQDTTENPDRFPINNPPGTVGLNVLKTIEDLTQSKPEDDAPDSVRIDWVLGVQAAIKEMPSGHTVSTTVRDLKNLADSVFADAKGKQVNKRYETASKGVIPPAI